MSIHARVYHLLNVLALLGLLLAPMQPLMNPRQHQSRHKPHPTNQRPAFTAPR